MTAKMAPYKDMLLSSPDPLGMSNGNLSSHSPTKVGNGLPLITPRKAVNEASGNAQVQEFYFNTPPHPKRHPSPAKSPRQTTQSTSPWRIRLTVEAEQMDDMQKSEPSPVKRLTERTTTITVPLKGGDDTPPAGKQGRGRPRKSLDSPVKRAGTPKSTARGRRKTMPKSPEKREEAHSETATRPRKPRGRPRKSAPNLDTSKKDEVDVWLGSSLADGGETAEMVTKPTRTKSRGRRQEITPMKIALNSDIESQSSSARIAEDVPKELAWTLGNRHHERDQMDQNLPETNEAATSQMQQSLDSRMDREHSTLGQQNERLWGSTIHRSTRSPSPTGDNAQNQADFDPSDQHQEYDSILESEGFSMVSVSSLPSVGDNPVSSPQPHGSLHEHTPGTTSSPSIAPAPETAKIHSSPRHLEKPSDVTPRLARAFCAGIALQGVLSPKDQSQRLGSPSHESQKPSPFLTAEKPAPLRDVSRPISRDKLPQKPLDDLFRGFGAGTRRELKAGLRLGEELAKRQQSNTESVVGGKWRDDVFQHTDSPKYPGLLAADTKECYRLKASGSEKQVVYPILSNNQLPSPERSVIDEEEDLMSWRADTPIKQDQPASASAQILVDDESTGPDASAIDYTMMAREEEWQREREAVSRQIEMASKSQVIVIDSDDDEEEKQGPEEDLIDSDIWQAEAQSADKSREITPEVSDTLLQPEVVKPRRSKLPSPWRRTSQVVYSDEVKPTESDLFWQPDLSQARDSKRRNARKGQTQDHSGILTDPVLDSSMENTRKAEAQIQLEALYAWPAERSLISIDEGSNAATSTKQTPEPGSIQQTDQTRISPVVVMPSEIQTVTELPSVSKGTYTNDVIEVSKKVTSLKVTEGTSLEPNSRTSKDRKSSIDPRLLQEEKTPPNILNQSLRPIQPLQSTQPSASWLSRLTVPIWSVFTPAAPLPPAATKEDILCSSPHEPLCQLTPWEECHFRALGPLYYGSLLYGAHLFPFNPRSSSARFCGAYVTTQLGWSRKITPEDCGITDAFMILLDERGFALGEPGARWIDEGMVITMCVALWVGMVKRGEIEVDRSKEERIGLRDQGDRKWTKDDIDWASNESAYFERKRREFDGLPSWKNKA